MADVTLLEAAKASDDDLERAVTRIIVEETPMLEQLPFRTINGPTFRYNREASLGTISFRGVNGTYTPDAGVINPQSENLVIMGGMVQIDKYEVDVMSNLFDLKMEKYNMKSRAVGLKFSEEFLEGDTAVDPYGFDGIRKRITGNQLIGTSGGVTLTLALLDQLKDLVIGDDQDKVFYMNKTLRRKVTALVLATGASPSYWSTSQDAFGRQQLAYSNVPIRVIERSDDASTFLDFDESDTGAAGGDLDTASIYCVRYGMDYVHGIQHGSLPSVQDFGLIPGEVYHKGLIEWYVGLVVKHPRSMARLRMINNA